MTKHSYCEIFVKYILPAVRLLIAKELIERHGYSQLEAAKALGISQPLINYFIKGKRNPKYVQELAKSKNVMKVVSYFADCIKEHGSCAEELSCNLCQALKETGEIDRILNKLGLKPESIVYPLCVT